MSPIQVKVSAGPTVGGSPSVTIIFPAGSHLPYIRPEALLDLLQPQSLEPRPTSELAAFGLPQVFLDLLPELTAHDANKLISNSNSITVGFWPPPVRRQLTREQMDAENVQAVRGILAVSPHFEVIG